MQFILISVLIYFFTTLHEWGHSSTWLSSRVGHSLQKSSASYLSNGIKDITSVDVDGSSLTPCPDLYQISSFSQIKSLTHGWEFQIFSTWFPDSLSYPVCCVCLYACINLKWDLHVLRGSDDKPGLQWVKPINVAGYRFVIRWMGWCSPSVSDCEIVKASWTSRSRWLAV